MMRSCWWGQLLLRLLLLLQPVTAAAVASTTATAEAAAASSSSFSWGEEQFPSRSRGLEVYALYNLPEVQITLTTQWTSSSSSTENQLESAYRLAVERQQGQQQQQPPSSTLLLLSQTGSEDSSLSYPFRSTTQTYLFKGFQHNIDAWQDAIAAGQDDGSRVFFSMYQHLAIVDVQVKLFLDLPRSPQLVFLDPVTTTTTSTPVQATLVAQVHPTVAFLEPTTTTSANNNTTSTPSTSTEKPSNEEVKLLFGSEWMFQDLFQLQLNSYLQRLTSTSNPKWMQGITTLQAEVVVHEDKVHNTIPTTTTSSSSTGWSSAAEHTMLAILIVVAVVGVAFVLLAVLRHRRQQYKRQLQALQHGELDLEDPYQDEYSASNSSHLKQPLPQQQLQHLQQRSLLLRTVSDAEGSHGDHSFLSSSVASVSQRPPALSIRSSSLDSARHGADVFHRSSTHSALTALEASDRYLAKHRPDLYSTPSANNNNNNSNNNSVNVFGRSYLIPSNPFDYIYKGYFQQPSSSSQEPYSHHAPFSSGQFTPTSDLLRRTSFATPSPTNAGGGGPAGSAFTPISQQQQQLNLAAAAATRFDEDDHHDRSNQNGFDGPMEYYGAHTGQTWQQQPPPTSSSSDPYSHHHPASAIGKIFRNLSISSWYNGSHPNSHHGHSEFPNQYYDDDPDISFHHSNDPSLINPDIDRSHGEIELEDMSPEEEYEFAFKDFPRVDGTPCFIYNEDALVERERQRKAKDIFVIDDSDSLSNLTNHQDEDYMEEDGSEKKQEDGSAKDQPVSDHAFKRMLSRNSSAIDEYGVDLTHLLLEETTTAGGIGAGDGETAMAKSPLFQEQLSRLVETKHRRFTMEQKKEAIVHDKRIERKHIREKQRLDRHKAMERDLEEIEAEFLSPLERTRAMQHPISPKRSSSSSGDDKTTTNTNAFSPVRTATTSGITAASPGSKLRTRSPARGIFGGSVRQHQRQNSLGASPFRRKLGGQQQQQQQPPPNSIGTHSPQVPGVHRRTNSNSNGIFRNASYDAEMTASLRSTSPPEGNGSEFVGAGSHAYQTKVRPVNMYESDMFGINRTNSNSRSTGSGTTAHPSPEWTDLSLPNMMNPKDANSKYPSPQSVIDEILQTGPSSATNGTQHHSIFNHRQSRTPTKVMSSQQQQQQQQLHRKINSFDVNDSINNNNYTMERGGHYPPARSPLKGSHRRTHSSSGTRTSNDPSQPQPTTAAASVPQPRHQRSNSQHSLGGRHRRSNSQSRGGSGHHRTNSQQQSDDIFLHGVVAQTRFV